MSLKYALLQKNKPREEIIARIYRYLNSLDMDTAWRVEVKEVKATRTLQQNAYLWFAYEFILEAAPEELGGWTKDDLHEFFLGSHFGWETQKGFGRKRVKPLKRSSKLSYDEFWELVEFIQRFMAPKGIVVPDPDPSLKRKKAA